MKIKRIIFEHGKADLELDDGRVVPLDKKMLKARGLDLDNWFKQWEAALNKTGG